jgi:hypothetical protein
VTTLAVDCARLRIAVDPGRLYDAEDPNYLLWVSMLVDRVSAANRQAKAEAERGAKGG